MNTKTQELVTAGYALAKGLDAESAKLVKELADELAVQRVRADELNKQVVNLAVENATVKERHCFIRALGMSILEHSGGRCDWRGAMADASELIQTVNAVYAALPATDVAIANIQAQGADAVAAQHQRKYEELLNVNVFFANEHNEARMTAEYVAAELRKGAL